MRVPRLALACLAIALSLWGVWAYAVRGHTIPKRFGTVRAGEVYRSGNLTAATTRLVVEKYGIRTIVDLGTHPPGSTAERRAERVAESLGVERVRLELSGDGTGNPNAYVRAVRIAMRPDCHPVLIQCGAGSERTGIAVVMYRVIHEGVPLEAALEEAGRYSHSDGRNPWFRRVVDEWLEPVRRAIKVDGGFIDGFAVP